MATDDKVLIMQLQNRDNAKRTRDRKKVYDLFLTNTIEALEKIVDKIIPKPRSSFHTKKNEMDFYKKGLSNKDDHTLHNNNTKKGGVSSLEGHLSIHNCMETLRRFLIMRISCNPQSELWEEVCVPNVIHQLPIPSYRNISELGDIEGHLYVLGGVEALINDTQLRIDFINSVSLYSIHYCQKFLNSIEINIYII